MTVVAPHPPPPVSRSRYVRGQGEWPFYLVCAWAPLWWALGLLTISFLVLAPFMVVALRRRRRGLVLPPAFGWWLAFLVVVALGMFALGRPLLGTLPESRGEEALGWLTMLANFTVAALVLVWVCNHDEEELPKCRLLHYAGVFAIWTVIGGYLGLLLPNVQFTSPTEALLRATLGGGPWMSLLDKPILAQVQDVLGEVSSARPAAPFQYTNTWGQMLSLLLVLGVVGWWQWGGPGGRLKAVVVVAAAVVPAILSLNRALWLGVVVLVAWILFQLARSGRVVAVSAVIAVILTSGAVIAMSPAASILEERASNGHSDTIRETLATDALEGAKASPVIGWGVMRQIQGSPQSIAVGSTEDCAQCGNRRIGSTGQLWYVMFAHGFVGAILFFGFYLACIWRYRNDTSMLGIAASGVVVLTVFYSIAYTNMLLGLCVAMVAIGLLYRNEVDRA